VVFIGSYLEITKSGLEASFPEVPLGNLLVGIGLSPQKYPLDLLLYKVRLKTFCRELFQPFSGLCSF
jgi:hypothetical protein